MKKSTITRSLQLKVDLDGTDISLIGLLATWRSGL